MKEGFLYMLAPMEDLFESCFRSVCPGVDLTFTEMVRFESLSKNNAASLKRIKLYDSTPTVIQIIGQREDFLEKFMDSFSPDKGFEGFNLNLGCPAPNFVNKGLGSAMVKRVSKTRRLIEIIRNHGYGVSIKMRLGLNEYEKRKKAYLNLINDVDADFFIVHARHGKENYSIKPDWSVFEECVKTGKDIIANGNISTKKDVERLSFCKGVMIGRSAVKDPLIFAKLKGIEVPSLDEIKAKYNMLLKERGVDPKYHKNVFENYSLKKGP